MKKNLILVLLTILSLLLATKIIAQQMTLDSLIRWEGNKGILTKTIRLQIRTVGIFTFPEGVVLMEIVEDE